MGRFIYQTNIRTEIEDRPLAHIQYVIGAKLRRGESFFFSWKDDNSIGGGRTSVWISPSTQLVIRFHGGRPPTLNRAWLEALTETANSPSGLYVVPEPAPGATRGEAHAGQNADVRIEDTVLD